MRELSSGAALLCWCLCTLGHPEWLSLVWAIDNKPKERRTLEKKKTFSWTSRAQFTISALIPSQDTLLLKWDPPLLDKKYDWAFPSASSGYSLSQCREEAGPYRALSEQQFKIACLWYGMHEPLSTISNCRVTGVARSQLHCTNMLKQVHHKFVMSFFREM